MGDCFKGTGKRVTETRVLGSFDKILVEDNIDLILTLGPIQEVKIEAGKNLIPLIKTEVNDSNQLHLTNNNRCNWARSYKKGNITVHITCPDFSRIKHFGSGLIKSVDTIAVDSLEIFAMESGDLDLILNTQIVYLRNIGSADITLHGRSELLGNFHTGEGYHKCENLQTDYIWSYSEASGNEYYHAVKNLSTTIKWDGDIYYKGNPTATRQGDGSGELIKLD